MKLRIWYIPQIPWDPFYKEVDSIIEWAKLLHTIYSFSQFEFKQKVKPDYSDAWWMEELNENWDWGEWEDENWEDIDSFIENIWLNNYL